MARYTTAEQAAAAGFTIVHEPDRSRFALYGSLPNGGPEPREVGEAHYTLGGSAEAPSIDFDHTLVDPALRGTGLSGLLANAAVTDEIVHGRVIHASCWFIDGYLKRHPELVEPGQHISA